MNDLDVRRIPQKTWVSSGLDYDTSVQPERYFTRVNAAILQTKPEYAADCRYTGSRTYEDESTILESQSVYSNPTAYIQTANAIDGALSYRVPRSGNQPRLMQTAGNVWFNMVNNQLPPLSARNYSQMSILSSQNQLPDMTIPGASEKDRKAQMDLVNQQRAADINANQFYNNISAYPVITDNFQGGSSFDDGGAQAPPNTPSTPNNPPAAPSAGRIAANIGYNLGNIFSFGLLGAIGNPLGVEERINRL